MNQTQWFLTTDILGAYVYAKPLIDFAWLNKIKLRKEQSEGMIRPQCVITMDELMLILSKYYEMPRRVNNGEFSLTTAIKKIEDFVVKQGGTLPERKFNDTGKSNRIKGPKRTKDADREVGA